MYVISVASGRTPHERFATPRSPALRQACECNGGESHHAAMDPCGLSGGPRTPPPRNTTVPWPDPPPPQPKPSRLRCAVGRFCRSRETESIDAVATVRGRPRRTALLAAVRGASFPCCHRQRRRGGEEMGPTGNAVPASSVQLPPIVVAWGPGHTRCRQSRMKRRRRRRGCGAQPHRFHRPIRAQQAGCRGAAAQAAQLLNTGSPVKLACYI